MLIYKTKNLNIALFLKTSVLVWASSNPMGHYQVAPRTSNCIGLISNTASEQRYKAQYLVLKKVAYFTHDLINEVYDFYEGDVTITRDELHA